MFDLKKHTILLALGGSHAYGTSTPTSDVDVRGVCISPLSYKLGFTDRFEQAENMDPLKEVTQAHITPAMREVVAREGVDGVVYDLQKFFKLAAEANPNILDILFCEETDRILCTPQGQTLCDHRGDFISLNAFYTFSGYAKSQLKRIRTHRAWLLHPCEKEPVREDFGLSGHSPTSRDQRRAAMAMIQKEVDSWEIDFGDLSEPSKIYIRDQINRVLAERSDSAFVQAGRNLGFDDNFLEYLERERLYKAARTDFEHYQTWKRERNAKRAALEATSGYDTKHAMHLVRLLNSCEEILRLGYYHVRRPDAEFLLSVRNGRFSFDDLMTWCGDKEATNQKLYTENPMGLPKKPDYKKLDRLCISLMESFHQG